VPTARALRRDDDRLTEIATIGVYGFSAETFLATLRAAGVPRLVDVRQRRGVRGPEYAWANARRLQDALAAAGVEYQHRPDLAPTTELRHLQYAEDARLGVGKRSRARLAPEYVRRYTDEILDRADLAPLAAHAPFVLLCVERDPEACHRSLIAQRLASEHGLAVTHLRPPA
jgi:uncharacterized protein (DUF488 family)